MQFSRPGQDSRTYATWNISICGERTVHMSSPSDLVILLVLFQHAIDPLRVLTFAECRVCVTTTNISHWNMLLIKYRTHTGAMTLSRCLWMLSVLVLIAFSALSSAFKLSSRTAFNVADGKPPTPTSLPAALASWPLTLGASRKSPRVLPNTENSLLQAIQGLDRREVQNSVQAQGRVSGLIKELEAAKGIPKATTTREINGKWRLLYTSSDSTASPIQNTFVGNKAFAVYQDIDIAPSASSSAPGTVTNIVDFGGAIGALNVQALASTPARPIPNFAPRLGDGRFFGLNILGISKTEVPRDSDPDDRE